MPSLSAKDGAVPQAQEGLAILRRRGRHVLHRQSCLVHDAGTGLAGAGCLPLDDPAALESDAQELAAVRARLEREDLTMLACRFADDRHGQAALNPRFMVHVLPDTAANTDSPPFLRHIVASPHSMLAAHLIDAAGESSCRRVVKC